MKKTIFTGAGTALVTPMNPNGSINFTQFGKLIEMQISGGIDALIVCGTTGEAAVMTDEERLACIGYAVQKAAGRVPIIAGTGSNNTAHAVFLSQKAVQAGVDALLLVTPYYNKTSQRGLIRHFTTIADAVDIPIILYNVPSRTGVNILPDTCRILAEHPNITAIKEASGNISQIAETARLCKDKLDIYSGNDDQIVPMLSLGAKGVISVLSNIMPKETHDICQLFFDGRVQESCILQLKLLPLIHALFSDVNPIPIKAAMNMLGLNCGECRLPLIDMEERAKEHLKVCLREVSLL